MNHFRNYGFFGGNDDAYTWFYRNLLGRNKFTDFHHFLLMKGHKDSQTFAEVSVTFKYTQEFASSLGLLPEPAIYLIASYSLQVPNTTLFFRNFCRFLRLHIFSQNGVKICSQNSVKMQSKCSQNAIKIQLKCSQNSV